MALCGLLCAARHLCAMFCLYATHRGPLRCVSRIIEMTDPVITLRVPSCTMHCVLLRTMHRVPPHAMHRGLPCAVVVGFYAFQIFWARSLCHVIPGLLPNI
jgi:hypothetical protein